MQITVPHAGTGCPVFVNGTHARKSPAWLLLYLTLRVCGVIESLDDGQTLRPSLRYVVAIFITRVAKSALVSYLFAVFFVKDCIGTFPANAAVER